MLTQLKTMYNRLMNSAGELWLENSAYYFANKDKMNFNDENPTPEYKKYREMNEREDILFRAADRVKDAIDVITQVNGAQSA